MVYNFLPFMVLPIYNVLAKIDDSVINAAQDLGANTFQTFIKIWLPLSLPGVISGITMVFVPSLTTFVISDLLGGSKILLIGNVIEQEFTRGSNWNQGSGLSLGTNKPVDVVIRPEDIDLVEPEKGTLVGTVTHLIFKGVHYEMEVTTPDGFEWLVHSTDMFPVGKQVGIHVDPFDIQIMNKPASEDEEALGVDE